MKLCIITLFTLICSFSISQQAPPLLPPNSARAYGALESHRFYDGLNQMIVGDQPINYLAAFPKFNPLDRPVELEDGEGQKGYFLEGNLDFHFNIYRGRIRDHRFWQTFRTSIRYAPTIRLSRDDDSKPVMPISNKIGLRFDKGIWHSYSLRKDIDLDDLDTLKFEPSSGERIQYLYATVNAAHYSNGMKSGSYIDDTSVIRNDYSKGNFSTNYVNLSLSYSCLKDDRLISASLGYQREFGYDGVAEYTAEQIYRYGYNRLLSTAQIRFRPFAVKNPLARNKGPRKKGKEYFMWYDYHKDTMIRIKRMAEVRIRYEGEYILDSKDSLFLYDRGSNYYKFSAHLYVEYNPWKWRTVGLFIHGFYGRDYLNIRYDDPVYSVMAGISLDFKKFIPPFMKTEKFQYTN